MVLSENARRDAASQVGASERREARRQRREASAPENPLERSGVKYQEDIRLRGLKRRSAMCNRHKHRHDHAHALHCCRKLVDYGLPAGNLIVNNEMSVMTSTQALKCGLGLEFIMQCLGAHESLQSRRPAGAPYGVLSKERAPNAWLQDEHRAFQTEDEYGPSEIGPVLVLHRARLSLWPTTWRSRRARSSNDMLVDACPDRTPCVVCVSACTKLLLELRPRLLREVRGAAPTQSPSIANEH